MPNLKGAGFFMVEMGLALVVATMLLASQVSAVSKALEDSQGVATGQYLQQLQNGINAYVLAMSTWLGTHTAAGVTPIPAGTYPGNVILPIGFVDQLKPTLDELVGNHFLAPGFSGQSPLGLKFKVALNQLGCPGSACMIYGVTYSTSGYTDATGAIRLDVLSSVINQVGTDAGFSFTDTPSKITRFNTAIASPDTRDDNPLGAVPGVVAVRVGSTAGIAALMNQFYMLNGTRPLQGNMDAGNYSISNINTVNTTDLNSTGQTIDNNLTIQGTAVLQNKQTAGTACATSGQFALNGDPNATGLVVCGAGKWQVVGNAQNVIGEGVACAATASLGQAGTSATGISYVCNGQTWTAVQNYSVVGSACTVLGKIVQSSTTGEQLICRTSGGVNKYLSVAGMLPTHVEVAEFTVADGSVVPKPTCNAASGAAPAFSFVMDQVHVDVTVIWPSGPYQGMYIAATDGGVATNPWTISIVNKTDTGAIESAVGVTAMFKTECAYL